MMIKKYTKGIHPQRFPRPPQPAATGNQTILGGPGPTHLEDDLTVCGPCLVIPAKMWREILMHLYESRQRSVSTKQRGHLTVYWPGINIDIDNACRKWSYSTIKNQLSQCQSQSNHSRRWLLTSVLMLHRITYVILVKCNSDWPDIIFVGHSTMTYHFTKALRQSLYRTGVPDILWSDQEPQFMCNSFQDFANRWVFTDVAFTPQHSHSNSKIEATVKSSWSKLLGMAVL